MFSGGFPDRPRPYPDPKCEGRAKPTDEDQPLPWSTDEIVGGVRTVDLAAEALQPTDVPGTEIPLDSA